MMFQRFLRVAAVAVAAALLPAGTFAQSQPLKIGVITSYSGGDNVAEGKELDTAMAAFIKEHGDTVAGRKLEFIKRDDTGIAPDVARRLAQELIVQEKVDMILGCAYTPNAIAIASVSTAAKKPFFIVNAATSGIIAKNPYSVRFGFTTAQITVPLANTRIAKGYKTAYAVFLDYGPGIDSGADVRKGVHRRGRQDRGRIANPGQRHRLFRLHPAGQGREAARDVHVPQRLGRRNPVPQGDQGSRTRQSRRDPARDR